MDSAIIVTILAVLIVTAVYVALDIMGLFSFKNHFPVEGRTVVITGGSQGFGRGLSKLLAQKGANIVIVARNEEKLRKALEYISSAAKNPDTQRFHYISAELTSPEENARVISEVTEWNGGLPPDVVWANAGVSYPMLFTDASPELLKGQMETNYLAAAYLAQATLKAWIKPMPSSESKGAGSEAKLLPRELVLTASSLAFCGIAGYATYAPAKAAQRNLSDCLRSEVNIYNGARRKPGVDPSTVPPADIKIASVYPGGILSPGFEEENRMKHPVCAKLEEGDPQQTEDEVSKAAVGGLEKGYYLISTQYLSELMRVSAMHGSPRNSWIVDTIGAWATSIAWLFIQPDMEGKVFSWGKKHGCESIRKDGRYVLPE